MRRKAALVLLALAVFCAALSPLLRWYVFPRLAEIPPDQYQDMVLEAHDATLLDYGTLRARKVPKATIVQTLRGDVAASERIERTAGRDVVVWDGLSYVQAPTERWSPRSPSGTSSTPTPRNPSTPPARWSTATRSAARASSSSGRS